MATKPITCGSFYENKRKEKGQHRQSKKAHQPNHRKAPRGAILVSNIQNTDLPSTLQSPHYFTHNSDRNGKDDDASSLISFASSYLSSAPSLESIPRSDISSSSRLTSASLRSINGDNPHGFEPPRSVSGDHKLYDLKHTESLETLKAHDPSASESHELNDEEHSEDHSTDCSLDGSTKHGSGPPSRRLSGSQSVHSIMSFDALSIGESSFSSGGTSSSSRSGKDSSRNSQMRNKSLSSCPKLKTKDSTFYLQCGNMTSLCLNSKKLNTITIPSCGQASPMPHLRILNLDGNRLTNLPENVSMLTSLESISIHNNKLKELPSNLFVGMIHLTNLGIHNNCLTSLPESLSCCESLSRFDAKQNFLAEAPIGLSNLSQIQRIDLDVNMIDAFPISYLAIPSLERLSLNRNNITCLPFCNPPVFRLCHLDICENKISVVAGSIFSLSSLRLLSLKDNLISSLPDSLSECVSLERLNLSNNHLVELPFDWSTLRHLSSLLVQNNKLYHLPESLAMLPKIQELVITGNPIIDPPLPLCVLGIETIRKYFQSRDHGYDATDHLLSFPPSHQCEIKYEDIRNVKEFTRSEFAILDIGIWREKNVVIKRLHREARDGKLTEKFANELHIFRSLQKSQHSNILCFYGACTKAPFFGIVMEYMENGSLYDYIRKEKSRLLFSDVRKMALDVSRGLHQLHHNSPCAIIHCDLKTANCLVDSRHTVKIADFGMSKLLGNSSCSEEETNYITCVPMYAAPEVLRSQTYSRQSDVFSLGMIMWELLTRDEPFSGRSEDVCKLIIQGERPPIPRSTQKQYGNLISKCWNQDPSKRPIMHDIVQKLQNM
eukprot:TRINITY_DN6510_c0_g2_i2.p1 TRINITY_DN6510_c0_g2~~TRINITY_DN6510_c0_g2_i2.p1  ORF type:complete len:833 (-),score=142.85 TRINITY_DN6510_c0_g2_i2:598-3096(-)